MTQTGEPTLTRPMEALEQQPTTTGLPIAPSRQVWSRLGLILREHTGTLIGIVMLHGLAALTALGAPWLLGEIVDTVRADGTVDRVDTMALLIIAALVLNAGLVLISAGLSIRFGEGVLARLREEFVDTVLRLPLGTVERAGTGDLVSRTGRDVGNLSHIMRYALPLAVVSAVTVVIILVALTVVHPLLLVAWAPSVPLLWWSTRWYARRAPDGYLREQDTYSGLTQSVNDTVEGAHTLEALGRQERQRRVVERRIRRSYLAERYTLWLRSVWFPQLEVGYLLPTSTTFLVAGWLYIDGALTLGQVATATFFSVQLARPVEKLLGEIDSLMVGFASLRRLLGVRLAGKRTLDTVPSTVPVTGTVELSDLRFGYTDTEVLHGVDLRVQPGERLAMVGPSGAGKSTLGKIIAGIHPPTSGAARVGGANLAGLSPEERRSRAIMLSQESHVFRGTIAENLVLAANFPDLDRGRLRSALAAVGADAWVQALPDGLDTRVGSGNLPLDPAHVQQLALARVVLADPAVLVLDEATSLMDPRSARDLERSLSGVLAGRTVVAIAHRLHTAHDADRIAVVEGGRIFELGTHDELLARDGSYAALWHVWHGETP